MAGPADSPDLERLVSSHLADAVRFATRLTGDLDAAEEVVQEALVRVVRSWKSFRGDCAFRTWLFRIVINAFRDRPPARRCECLEVDPVDPFASDPAEEAVAEELGREIAVRVSALPPRQREVLVLVTYEAMTPRQVAQLLEISEANVYATLHAARERLRRELAAFLSETRNGTGP